MVSEKETMGFGDRVVIETGKKSYEGRLLENPEEEKDIFLLKLDSGYNIGINKKNVFKKQVIEKFNSGKKESFKKESKKELPNIAMIITGGTIASKLDSRTGGVTPIENPEDLFRIYPKMFEKVNVSSVEVPFMKSSENMNYKDWKKIASVVEEKLNDSNIKGVVITHGTDFLHYTSAALSFFLGKVNKPVVLTYSQRSIDRASSDANLNLQCSALAAISDINEVMLVGHANNNDNYCHAIRGTKVRKMHSSRRDAFKAINDKPLAKIYPNRIEPLQEYNIQKPIKKLKADKKFEDVALIKFYPGQSPEILDYYFEKGYKGVVLEMSGLGHIISRGSENNWLPKIKDVIKKGMIVCGTTQCLYGRTDNFVYSVGRETEKAGVIYLNDMLPETALVKLGWVLGHKEWIQEGQAKVKEIMLKNFVGELNNRLEE